MAQIQVKQDCDCCDSVENVDWYCTDCDEILCDNCKISHLRTKKLKNDTIIPLKEARNVQKSAVIMCNNHSSEKCTIYCLSCNESVCTVCYHDGHQNHKWTLLDKYITFKRESLNSVLNELKKIDSLCSEAVTTTEYKSHDALIKSIDQTNHKIDLQKVKAKKKISELCKRYHLALSEIRNNEEKRYQSACDKIQNQKVKVQTIIHKAQIVIDKGDLSQLLQAENDAMQILQESTKIYPKPKLTTIRFLPGDMSDQAVSNFIGVLETDEASKSDDTEEPENSGPPSREPEPHSDKPDRDQEHEIDVTKVKIKSVIQVQGISGIIRSIVPVDNNRMWVVQYFDRHLTLTDCHGQVIKKSVTVNEGEFITDVKLYNNDLLIICDGGQKVIRMSSDGTATSTFHDLAPYYKLLPFYIAIYYTHGLCIGQSNNVLVICVQYTKDRSTITESKVVRLNESGGIIQTIQHDHTGARLFTDPYSLISMPSGDIMVIDGHKVTAVDSNGKYLLTLDGEKDMVKGDNYHLCSITQDRYNHVFITDYYHHKVYMIGREGKGGKCLKDIEQGISWPWGIAINHDGQLLVGCMEGKVYTIHY